MILAMSSCQCAPELLCVLSTACRLSNNIDTWKSYRTVFFYFSKNSDIPLFFNTHTQHGCFIVILLLSPDDDVDEEDGSPDFYINICQPLNPIPGVKCPSGATVCLDPDNGPPVVGVALGVVGEKFILKVQLTVCCRCQDIGRTTSGPVVNARGEVSITYLSATECSSDTSLNYSSTIIFTCQRGLEMVSPCLTTTLCVCARVCDKSNFLVIPNLSRVLHKCCSARAVCTSSSGPRPSCAQTPHTPATATSPTPSCSTPSTCPPSPEKCRCVARTQRFFI